MFIKHILAAVVILSSMLGLGTATAVEGYHCIMLHNGKTIFTCSEPGTDYGRCYKPSFWKRKRCTLDCGANGIIVTKILKNNRNCQVKCFNAGQSTTSEPDQECSISR